MLLFFQAYKTPLLQTSLCLSLTLLLTFLKIPIIFLHSLHTYILPDNLPQQNPTKAAIRRPSSSPSPPGLDGYHPSSSKTNTELKRRTKFKEKFEFDESNAQIFRLTLDEGHLQSRLYFNEYWYSFIYSSVAFLSFLLSKYLDDAPVGVVNDTGILAKGSFIPVILGFVALCKVIFSLASASFEKSASKRSEKQLSVVAGALGIGFGFMICSGIGRSIFYFDFGSADGFWKVYSVILMGCIAGFLYMPACKNARSFWLGTDQVRSDMGMISCGWFARMILHANYLVSVFAALLWINPFAEILFIKNVNYNSIGTHSNSWSEGTEKLLGNVGFTHSDFTKFRLWCLLLSGIFQIVALRPNLQMFLNEALLSWYQRLHASKVPDLEFSRAKVFLHNHYLCLVVLQFLASPFLILLFLGLSQIDGDSFKNFQLLDGLLPCSSFIKEMTLFMAWWVVLVWTVFTSASLLLYRRGSLYLS